MSKIAIHSNQEAVSVDRGRMREIVRTVLAGEGVADYEISLAFVDNPTIHTLNKRYLDHDEPTDVLSFPLSEPNAKKLAGELVLGVEVAQERANELAHPVETELALYVIHGLLHLCGYDDNSDAAERRMRERERHYLQQLRLPDIVEQGVSGMAVETACALVIRGSDWSESSRIATLWSREFGKVRGLAKGGRRPRSGFENALDLLNLVDVGLIRKSSGGLDLLTEARVRERVAHLRRDLAAWYAGLYVAELLGDWTQDHDPHPALFDEAVETLRELGQAGATGPRVAQFELVLLRELGYGPALEHCAACSADVSGAGLAFSAARGALCGPCQASQRDRLPLPPDVRETLLELRRGEAGWRGLTDPGRRAAVRRLLNDYVTYALGRRPRLLAYLGS